MFDFIIFSISGIGIIIGLIAIRETNEKLFRVIILFIFGVIGLYLTMRNIRILYKIILTMNNS
ncbi:hypothetical protein [Streptobacillus moniliformis]|uniref:hypothetical protein n=1 Tax=Streptobacillus moniliformis TaxID=34105 RepID=UPI0007E32AE8|nr:hypothetical protein [Streptobacillus moniliformis]